MGRSYITCHTREKKLEIPARQQSCQVFENSLQIWM